jgi:hypothetical protein
MIRCTTLFAALALLGAPAAHASASASSASSEGISASVGSVSTSIEGSSTASSPGARTAAGPYRVIQVAAALRAGFVRVALEALEAPAGRPGFALWLPETNPQAALLAPGDVVVATAREYGLQFARAGAAEPFFLVVDDARLPELKTRPVGG